MEQLQTKLQQIISHLFDVKDAKVNLTYPQYLAQGDVSTNVALTLAKQVGQSPVEVAKAIESEFTSNYLDSEVLDRVEVVKPGFLNFFFSQNFLYNQLENVLSTGKTYGASVKNKSGKIMVEFAHPNTHKPVHIGHLRNMCLGESICRLLEANGVEVVRANYQGDVGLHIAKALWAMLQNPEFKIKSLRSKTVEEKAKFLGEAYALGSKAYESEDVEAKEEILDINEKIYNKKDKEINKLWEETRRWSLDYMDNIYERVSTFFDRFYFEGEVFERGKELVLKGLEDGVFEESDGAVIFDGEKYGFHKRVFITSSGLPTYEAKDMALGELQFKEYSPDKIIHLVAREQEDYFKVMFRALVELFPEMLGREEHLVYGWVSLSSGKMSSRMGEVVLAEDILDSAVAVCRLEKVGVGAVKYEFLKYSPNTDIVFDVKTSVSLEGNSGPYIQYAYTRCKSILKKAKNIPSKLTNLPEQVNMEEKQLLLDLVRFPSVVSSASTKYAPNLICNYLFDLAQNFSIFYERRRVIGESAEKFRLCLVSAVAQVLANGLDLLGIDVVEEM